MGYRLEAYLASEDDVDAGEYLVEPDRDGFAIMR